MRRQTRKRPKAEKLQRYAYRSVGHSHLMRIPANLPDAGKRDRYREEDCYYEVRDMHSDTPIARLKLLSCRERMSYCRTWGCEPDAPRKPNSATHG
jgi:hypothetical protein